MSIRNAKNFNRSLKKLNSSYSNEVTDSTETSSSLGLKGLLKRGMNQQAIQLEISAAAGQGGAGSPRGGRCSGGNGGGGGGGLVRYTTNTFDTIPYSIGASGTPRGGGGEESQPSAAPSGTGTLVFGYPFGGGGSGGTSAWGKHGNPGEPPCYSGNGGSGGSGGSVPAPFLSIYGTSGSPTDSIQQGGQPGPGGAKDSPGGNGAQTGYPGCGTPTISPYGPFPIGGPAGNTLGPKQPAGFVQIRSGNRFSPS